MLTNQSFKTFLKTFSCINSLGCSKRWKRLLWLYAAEQKDANDIASFFFNLISVKFEVSLFWLTRLNKALLSKRKRCQFSVFGNQNIGVHRCKMSNCKIGNKIYVRTQMQLMQSSTTTSYCRILPIQWTSTFNWDIFFM